MNASEALIKLVKTGDMDVARTLIHVKDVSTQALNELIANGELEPARAVLSILEDNGRDALVLAAESGQTEFAKSLIELGADGPRALLSLLRDGYRESAVRLASQGVDIEATLLRAYTGTTEQGRTDLLTMGAKLPVVVTQAIALGDIQTAKKMLDGQDKSVGQAALEIVLDDETLTDEVKAARLTQLLGLTANADTLLMKLINDGRTADLRRLIALGAPTHELLMDFGKQGNRLDAQKLFIAGADFTRPISTLQTSNEHEAAGVLVLALTGARDVLMAAHTP